MRNLFILFAFVTSVAIANVNTNENVEATSNTVAYRLCTTLQTSCGPSGDICGADAHELARNSAWAENYWCGD